MLNSRNLRADNSGFSLIEMLIVLSLISIVGLGIYGFTVSSGVNYLNLHADGLRFSELSDKSQRVSRVLRGAGDITNATSDTITLYAYFSPADHYYSLITYYKDTANRKLMADVTPLDANPPIGQPINAKKLTFTIMEDFYTDPAVSTFQYLDSAGNAMPLPISDLHTVKGIRANLATASKSSPATTKSSISVQVSLRNRKTNL
jgi:prepilin-type N-terminal cleavage/methylation domain-containing protein